MTTFYFHYQLIKAWKYWNVYMYWPFVFSLPLFSCVSADRWRCTSRARFALATPHERCTQSSPQTLVSLPICPRNAPLSKVLKTLPCFTWMLGTLSRTVALPRPPPVLLVYLFDVLDVLFGRSCVNLTQCIPHAKALRQHHTRVPVVQYIFIFLSIISKIMNISILIVNIIVDRFSVIINNLMSVNVVFYSSLIPLYY